MATAAITILGLGPGSIGDLTLEAQSILKQAADDCQRVYCRTTIHPTVEALLQQLPQLQIASFDRLYDEAADWGMLYQQIAQEVCALAEQQPVIYAVPGHPLVGEASVQILIRLARERNLTTAIVAGLSFLEPVYAALELDPCEHGMQLVDATNLAALRTDELAGKLIPTVPLLVAQVYNRRLASQVKLALSEFYPDEWSVKLVRAAGVAEDETVIELPLYELDRDNVTNHLSTLYLPPLDVLAALRLPETLRYITMRLRREPDGCPWDRALTHHSLIKYVIEETYEVVEALEEQDMEKLADELGDLLLQVYLHAELARQDGDFAIGDVYEHINAKLIRRHPHVFGDVEVNDAAQVLQNWEAIKREERKEAGKDVQKESVLDGVPQASPALIIAQEYQKRAARIGFDFSNQQQLYAKLEEELRELQEAATPDEQLEEMGDLMFMVARLARSLKIDAEEALRRANRKFRRRFQAMEELARQEERAYSSYSSEEWRALWKRAKARTQQEQINH
ncbi:MAG TPA: nucleoside triphosphate pyrophosphohydrolase [Ktedonobacteraceae bacterium]|nr:nucleoside triphosphate pyrophosphohydrolase [Ktedonobacteraceae bacterium]